MMTKCWVTYVILRPGLLHHNYLIIPLKLKGFGVPMIRCLLTLRGLLARGSLYVAHNLRFSNNMDLTLSNAFMRPKVSIPISFVMFETKAACCLVAVLLVVYACDCLSERLVVSACSRLGGVDPCMAAPLVRTWRSMLSPVYYAQTARSKPRAK